MVPRPSTVTSTRRRCNGHSPTHMVYGALSFNGNLNSGMLQKSQSGAHGLWCLVPSRRATSMLASGKTARKRSRKREVESAKSEERSWKREAGSAESEERRWKREVGSAKSEERSWKREVGSAKSEERSWKSEVRSAMLMRGSFR